MFNTIPNDMMLYFSNEKPISSFKFKNKLFKFKFKEKKCENCKLDTWLDSTIPLELHHIDGNHINNNLENIQILCPNCHSLTHNYRGKNKKPSLESIQQIKEAISESETIGQVINKLGYSSNASSYHKIRSIIREYDLKLKEKVVVEKNEDKPKGWISDVRKDAWIKSRKVNRPSKEELLNMVWNKSISNIANELGITDNGIRKWAKNYNIPVPPIGYWAKFNNGHIKQCENIKINLFEKYNISAVGGI